MEDKQLKKKVLVWAAAMLTLVLAATAGCRSQASDIPSVEEATALPSVPVIEATTEPQAIPTTAAPEVENPTQANDEATPTEEPTIIPPTATPAQAESTAPATNPPTPTFPAQPSGGGATPSLPSDQPTSAPPAPVAGGDYSGPQDSLSDYEQAAQAAGSAVYTGQRCRVDVTHYTCDCPPDTITASFTFSSPNDLVWTSTSSVGTSTINMARAGINTWTGTVSAVDNIVIRIELIFTATGYQQTAETVFPDGQTVACPMIWTRQ